MERVVGLDLSLTSTGIGVITRRARGDCIATIATISSRGKRDDGIPERASRIGTMAEEIAHAAASPVLVVIEGPSHGSRGGSPVDRHGLWWRVVDALVARSVPVAVCPPATRAKFITGSGKADKAAVSAAVGRLWPDLEITNADEGDALAHAGAVQLQWPVSTLQRHRDCLAAIRWPELPAMPAAHPINQAQGA